MPLKTIHLVFNAHIDPVWLWPWSSGLDEILNTCESMCNLLDRHPDVIFTRGEAWVYEQVEKIDSALFQRIRKHIEARRWEVVGGWYVQPDCNLPGWEGLHKQVELGRDYFQSRFGLFPETAYNVDSFGHTAFLPELMAAHGQKNYVMMRPQEHEKELPARLFRWRAKPGGAEITTFRIAGFYNGENVKQEIRLDVLQKSLTELPSGITHTMCFAGVGDHGGGPTEAMIEWCRANRDIIPGARLEFSSPARFFRAIAAQKAKLPLVTGELQMHAVGCYSVHRAIKLGVRRAEHLLAQAGEAVKQDAALAKAAAPELDKSWRWVCFNHFHDTLGGTCLPTSYAQADAQLGYARAAADEVLQHALRRRSAGEVPDIRQRFAIANFSGSDFDGWIEHEPWMEGLEHGARFRLLDERGREVPHQRIDHEAIVFWRIPRLLFRLKVKPGAHRILRLATREDELPDWGKGAALTVKRDAPGLRLHFSGLRWTAPALQLVEDPSDTWSHDVHTYDGKIVGEVKWSESEPLESGPFLQAWLVKGKIGKSSVIAEWRRYAGEDFFELRLRVTWLETHRLLRLNWRPGSLITSREEGVSGGSLRRESDGRERPVRDWTLLSLKDGQRAGVVFPDTFSLSATSRDLRLTLLRSSIMAHHGPYPKADIHEKRQVISDRGEQTFLFRFYPPGKVTAATLEQDALTLQRPPLIADVTRGMPGLKK